MRIRVNGLEREVREGLTLRELLEADREPVGHALVEVNGAHVHVREYGSRILAEGDHVEIILPAFGG
jgi:thiamine biosynthesis protein ThiS